ncbi:MULTISPECIES: VWA domain-containing protein [Chryseobacterium]|uniref:Outer membrane cobalamin receptor protein n=1 Tax=Chryseobacterium taihuense TaxID=1141221 RepID=A0A4U8W8E0_9FLAO|nr:MULTISPECIES: VWA domain-containing protein [Chryseobacterium]QQV04357.1 TonB-dependent receptor plug domain-containing protein [Chryseobacterium sp. FDAARGOS 1104]VFB02263.1 Outer membrane cobalamin receptor protein [Chryseobacterium taihuense]
MENNHDIDKKFNEAYQSVEEPVTFPGFDKVWEKVEKKLDKKEHQKKIIPIWFPYGMAASLIIGLGAFYFIDKNNASEIEKPAIVQNTVSPETNSNVLTIDSMVKSNIEKEIHSQKQVQKSEILAYEDVNIDKGLKLIEKGLVNTNESRYIKPAEINQIFAQVPVDSGFKERSIEEVVVLGYSKTVSKSKPVASSSVVSENFIAENVSSAGLLNSLSGEASGLSINSSSGTPGSFKNTILIRGAASIKEGSEPLYIINGEIASGEKFKKLKPENIKEVSVVKDAAATSVYGSRAANGVIVISTKDASKSKNRKFDTFLKKLFPKAKTDIIDKSVDKEEVLPKAGQLTAGEANDFSKWNYWMDIAVPALERYKGEWKFFPEKRVSVQLVNKNKKPVVGEKLKLVNDKNEVVWESVTDNLGNAELWINPITKVEQNIGKYILKDQSNNIISNNPKEFKNGQNLIVVDKPCIEKRALELAFVVDATGSMGDEIAYLQAELLDVLKKVESNLKNTEIRYGSVFYRDKGDEYVTKKFEFSDDADQLLKFIKEQKASGGGDFPEAVVEAMDVSVNDLKWSNENSTKIMFLILDAPPHQSAENIDKIFKYIKTAAQKGITIIPIAASDIDKQTEYLMRTFALMTNGTYTFLTNHSGIGNNHIEPTVESYEVEKLNDLILRLILQRATLTECDKNISQNYLNKKLETEAGSQIEHQVKIFPNPTKGAINIISELPIHELFVYDLAGKIIMKKEKLSGKSAIDISCYPQSVYLIRAKTEKGWETFKIIKN